MPRWSNSVFTSHAQERLSERFEISEEQLLEQLNVGRLGVKLGVSKETHLVHRLIWSEYDNNHIVIIQDVINGSILTVLTVDMYRRDYPERLNDKRIQKAINQLKNRKSKMDVCPQKPSISAIFVFDDGRRLVRSIGKWKEKISMEEIEYLGSRQEFWDWVLESIAKKELPLNDLQYVSGGYSMADRVRIEYAVEKT